MSIEQRNRSFLSKPGVASVITAFVGVVALMIIFAMMNPNFIRPNNLMSLARSICPYLLVGIGQGIVCITGNIDLSIGSVLGMSAMISATLICGGMNVILAIIILDLLLANFLMRTDMIVKILVSLVTLTAAIYFYRRYKLHELV